MANLTLRNVKKAYGNLNILHGIDLDIKSGEFVVFVGPSGCGKSTLLRTIAGLEDITDGTLQIAGETVNDVPPSKRGIAMVFQSYALYPHMTVYDNMAFGMKIARESKAEIDRRVRQAAEILQLTKYLDRLPKALSGGQRQRVAIGRAIVRNPKVFLFDEPLSNLDAALRVATRIEIAKLKESMPNTTMVYVTHDQVEAMTLADRIVVLKDGRVEQVGSPMDLYCHPGNLFVAQFIGSPAMNILPATIEQAGQPTSVLLADGREVEVPVATPVAAVGASISFGVRPEDLRIGTGADYLFEGTVDYVEQLGEVQLVYVEIGSSDGPLVAKLPGGAAVKRGTVMRLAAEPGNLHIFGEDGRSFARNGAAATAALSEMAFP
ncbi:sn-glycerol-3-phosphate ABC transporter ATP-binding protein UgpC [Mesorhizobium sp. KR1-2]|uniref:ABC transporter ATP-binding protein n=1 Tax=Mesorhizobium sp. KR1-2 TaxID=3156609 RepID=UPI0032B44D7B